MSAATLTAAVPIPADQQPLVTILIPCLNESVVIGEFVDWCFQGLKAAGVSGEVLIADSSTDDSPKIAQERGARVLRVAKLGLGQAYIDALEHVRGKYVILGDCDLTYDFREIKPFLDKLQEGYEFVMGNRFAGGMEPDAMPRLHRYFGTPVTTALLNLIHGTRFGDIHCGMRGLTTDALRRIKIQSRSWQYASEMIIKAAHLNLRMTEIAIPFYKDRAGRESHHKRRGWTQPWHAGWITLQTMFTYGADFFLVRPGMVLLDAGLLIVLATSLGPVQLGRLGLSLHWTLAGMCACVLGLQSIYMGLLARLIYDYSGATAKRYLKRFSYDRSVLASALVFSAGVLLTAPLIVDYARQGLALPELARRDYLAVSGLLCMIGAFLNFSFTLVLHAYLAVKEYWQ